MRVVSYSLFGTDEVYLKGAVNNAILIPEIYPGWEMWVFHNDTVSEDVLSALRDHNVRLIYVDEDAEYYNATWRFSLLADPTVEYFIARDADSRPTLREKFAVDQWLESGKK